MSNTVPPVASKAVLPNPPPANIGKIANGCDEVTRDGNGNSGGESDSLPGSSSVSSPTSNENGGPSSRQDFSDESISSSGSGSTKDTTDTGNKDSDYQDSPSSPPFRKASRTLRSRKRLPLRQQKVSPPKKQPRKSSTQVASGSTMDTTDTGNQTNPPPPFEKASAKPRPKRKQPPKVNQQGKSPTQVASVMEILHGVSKEISASMENSQMHIKNSIRYLNEAFPENDNDQLPFLVQLLKGPIPLEHQPTEFTLKTIPTGMDIEGWLSENAPKQQVRSFGESPKNAISTRVLYEMIILGIIGTTASDIIRIPTGILTGLQSISGDLKSIERLVFVENWAALERDLSLVSHRASAAANIQTLPLEQDQESSSKSISSWSWKQILFLLLLATNIMILFHFQQKMRSKTRPLSMKIN